MILQAPLVAIRKSASNQGLVPTAGYMFGTITNIHETSDRFQVGQSVLFPPNKGIELKDGSLTYWLLDEKLLLGSEEELPP